ncbi:MAG: glycosyltransferase family 1 protein, partial [Mesorhizobium sp.]
PRDLGDRVSEALADLGAYIGLMPGTADLKARFGADVMAAEIEKAYFAALGR